MAQSTAKLSAVQLNQPMANGRHRDGTVPGLYFRVVGVSRSWMLRVVIDGKRCDVGLGSYPKVGLAKARELAKATHEKIAEGRNPLVERQAEKEAKRVESRKRITFRKCAERAIEIETEGLKNAKHVAQWTSTLETYAYPTIGDKPVGSITKHDIVAVLEPIWGTKHETARRLRGRMEKVFNHAKSMDYMAGDNPAAFKGNLEALLLKAKPKPKNQPSLPHAQIGTFMAELRRRSATAARALEFAILTATRSGEVLGATWDEIDLDAKLWTIPEGRMKAEQEHEVPLSDAAVALLKALPRVEGVPYVFPAERGGKLSDMALSMLVRRINGDDPMFVDRRTKRPVVPHGFRSTFREWAGEATAYPREVIEHALAHMLPDKAERAYQRGSLLPKRARLMDDWAKRCAMADNAAGNVVAIKGAA